MILCLHMIFSLERATVVWAILERISGFDPSFEMTDPRYLKFSTASSFWPFIPISLWKPLELFKADSFVVLAKLHVAFLWEFDIKLLSHPPVFQILLQIEVRMSNMASPAWTNSASMLATPADFPIFSALTAASTTSRRIGWRSSSSICGQSSTIGSPSVSSL